MTAAYIEYDDSDIGHSEFLPLDRLRINVAGEWNAGVQINDVEPGKNYLPCSNANITQRKLDHGEKEHFYRVQSKLDTGNCKINPWYSFQSYYYDRGEAAP